MGHSRERSGEIPKRIEFFEKNSIKAKDCIAAGRSNRSGLISVENELYLFGLDLFGGKCQPPTNIETQFEGFDNIFIEKVTMSGYHIALIAS